MAFFILLKLIVEISDQKVHTSATKKIKTGHLKHSPFLENQHKKELLFH